MIAIQQANVTPSSVHCGQQCIVSIVVEWSAPDRRSVEAWFRVPAPFAFSGPMRDTKVGSSPLTFDFPGSFSGPSGTHTVILDVYARQLAPPGNRDQDTARVEVTC